jgi:hypothetical protein
VTAAEAQQTTVGFRFSFSSLLTARHPLLRFMGGKATTVDFIRLTFQFVLNFWMDLWEKSWKPLGLKKLPWRKFLRGQLHVQQICQNLESLGLHRNFSRTILCKAEKLRNNGASRKILEAFCF